MGLVMAAIDLLSFRADKRAEGTAPHRSQTAPGRVWIRAGTEGRGVVGSFSPQSCGGSDNKGLEVEKTILRKVGEAIARFKMIREGDRVAVALSGGKDSLTLLEALLLMQHKAPINFTVCAFTVEQGKFLKPFEPMGEYLKSRGIGLELPSGPTVSAPAGRTTRSWLRPLQPLPAPCRVQYRARPGRQRDRVRPHCR